MTDENQGSDKKAKSVTVGLGEDEVALLNQIADRECRPVNWQARMYIREGLERDRQSQSAAVDAE